MDKPLGKFSARDYADIIYAYRFWLVGLVTKFVLFVAPQIWFISGSNNPIVNFFMVGVMSVYAIVSHAWSMEDYMWGRYVFYEEVEGSSVLTAHETKKTLWTRVIAVNHINVAHVHVLRHQHVEGKFKAYGLVSKPSEVHHYRFCEDSRGSWWSRAVWSAVQYSGFISPWRLRDDAFEMRRQPDMLDY